MAFVFIVCFFCKQNTASEVLTRDWSSDVCSADLALAGIPGLYRTRSFSRNGFAQVTAVFDDSVDIYFARHQIAERLRTAQETLPSGVNPEMGPISTRSEEHTSELQSLMRISYAVFCLKKKNNNKKQYNT